MVNFRLKFVSYSYGFCFDCRHFRCRRFFFFFYSFLAFFVCVKENPQKDWIQITVFSGFAARRCHKRNKTHSHTYTYTYNETVEFVCLWPSVAPPPPPTLPLPPPSLLTFSRQKVDSSQAIAKDHLLQQLLRLLLLWCDETTLLLFESETMNPQCRLLKFQRLQKRQTKRERRRER